MADKIGRAVLEITIDGQQYQAALGALDKRSDETAEHVRGISEALHAQAFIEFGRIAVEAVAKIGEGIIALGERGAAVEDVTSSFDALTASAGSTASTMLGALREGVAGTMSDFDLMKEANRALGAGLIHNADDMRTLAEGARALAKASGEETPVAFEKLMDAMAKGRTSTLRMLGVFVDSKQAVKDYADSHGLATSQLTDEDRAAANTAAALTALRERLKLLPPDAKDFGEKLAAAKVELANFVDKVAVGIARSPVLAAGMDAAGKAITEAFGKNKKVLIEDIVHAVEKFAIGVTYVAEGGVMAAQVIGSAWYGLGMIFNNVMSEITGKLGAYLSLLGTVLAKSSEIPGVGDHYRNVGAGVTALATDLQRLSVSFNTQAGDALKSAADTNTSMEKVRAGVVAVRDAMIAAEGTVAKSAKPIRDGLGGIGDAAGHMGERTEENAKKVADKLRELSAEVAISTKEGLDKRLAEIQAAKEKELAQVRELKQVTVAEQGEMVRLIEEKYARQVAVAKASGDSIRDRMNQLAMEVQIATVGQTQGRLLQIEQAHQQEIQKLQFLRENYGTVYEQMKANADEKYRLMKAAAQGYFETAAAYASNTGIKTRAEMQQAVDSALAGFEQMKASGEFTAAALQEAWDRYTKAKAEMDGKAVKTHKLSLDEALGNMSSVLRDMFGKNKTAAIAAAIMDTAAAVAKANAAYAFPFSIPPMAAAFAAGMKQVQEIRSASFKEGTPGLDFMDFGTETPGVALHGNEAVIPQGGGHRLAGEIASAMPGMENALLQRILSALERMPGDVTRAIRNGQLLAAR